MSCEASTSNNVTHAARKKRKGGVKSKAELQLFKESRVFHVLTRDQSRCHETFLNYRQCPSPFFSGGGGRGGAERKKGFGCRPGRVGGGAETPWSCRDKVRYCRDTCILA